MKSQMFRKHLFWANKLSPKMSTYLKGKNRGIFWGLRSGFWVRVTVWRASLAVVSE